MKPLWAAFLALAFASPAGAVQLSYDDLPTIIVFGLSTVSYNATTSIWNEHNTAPSFLLGDFDHNTDDLNVVYDLTVSVGQDKVPHGGIFSLFGSSVKLGITPKLLMSGHVNQFFFLELSFETYLTLDFAAPEIRAGDGEKFTWIHTLARSPLPFPQDWTSASWTTGSLLHSPDIFSINGLPAVVPEPAILGLMLPGLLFLGMRAKRVYYP
jgi:hypothetical protein